MKLVIGWLPVGLIACLGCGGKPPAAPETEAQGAARVFAVAQELENSQKTNQALDAYQQVVRYDPNTPKAGKATQRIAKGERDATQRSTARKRNT